MQCVPPKRTKHCERHPHCLAAHDYITQGFIDANAAALQLYAAAAGKAGHSELTPAARKALHLCDGVVKSACYTRILKNLPSDYAY